MVKATGKLITVFFALTTIALAVGPLHAASHDPIPRDADPDMPLVRDERVPKFSTSFAVNDDTSYRLIIPDKCESRGESALGRLAAVSTIEEAYVFIPDLCLWMETGYDETEKTVVLDAAFIDNVLMAYPSIVLYHTHIGTPAHVLDYFPAYADMITLVLLNGRYLDLARGRVLHRAITARGVIEYDFIASEETERLIETIVRVKLGDFLSQNLAYEFSRAAHRETYYEALQACGDTTGDDPRRLADCFPVRAGDFLLKFRPFEEPKF